jgi:hypothetical protein
LITLIAFKENVRFLHMAGVVLYILVATLVVLRGDLSAAFNLSL